MWEREEDSSPCIEPDDHPDFLCCPTCGGGKTVEGYIKGSEVPCYTCGGTGMVPWED